MSKGEDELSVANSMGFRIGWRWWDKAKDMPNADMVKVSKSDHMPRKAAGSER